jgi:hypothetical protein
MGFRRRNYELEADLYKVPTPWLFRREMGELERTSYEDGEERLKISFRGLDIPDGAAAEVVIDGAVVAELPVSDGRARQILTTTEGHSVPEAKAGQEVEIRFQGTALLAGVFKRD